MAFKQCTEWSMRKFEWLAGKQATMVVPMLCVREWRVHGRLYCVPIVYVKEWRVHGRLYCVFNTAYCVCEGVTSVLTILLCVREWRVHGRFYCVPIVCMREWRVHWRLYLVCLLCVWVSDECTDDSIVCLILPIVCVREWRVHGRLYCVPNTAYCVCEGMTSAQTTLLCA